MTASLSKEELKQVEKVLGKVHWLFKYRYDVEYRKRIDHWVGVDEIDAMYADPNGPNRGDFKDDCDGFALLCRYLLRKLNIPNRLVYCRTETGEYHLVCSAQGWILDNRNELIMSRHDVPYVWISISGYEKGDPWREVIPV